VTHMVVLLVAWTTAWLLTPSIGRLATRVELLDRPGPRKIHQVAVPCCGGFVLSLAVTAALAIAWCLVPGYVDLSLWPPALLGGMVVFAVGIWDDLRPRSPLVKLGFQGAAALLALGLGVRVSQITLAGIPLELELLAGPVTVLWIVGLTNAFNLVDGLDGLGSSLAIIAAVACAIVSWSRNDVAGSILMLAVAGGLGGFLPYNMHPARGFLGDGGSLLVGYWLAIGTISGTQGGHTAIGVTVPLLIFALPLADTAWSLVRRTCTKGVRSVFEPDQHHLHHRLLAFGLSQTRTVLLLCGVSLFLATWALALLPG
jgi:UDP-GlcNAc:undecaprenyl-phosphate/decaprenyl-phosphate GlcNAc-1-phosphate transferase